MGFVVFFLLSACFTILARTSNANNIEKVSNGDDVQSPEKYSFYTRNSHLKNHTYKLLSRSSIAKRTKHTDHSKHVTDGSASLRSTTLRPSETGKDGKHEVGSQSATKHDIIEGNQSPAEETGVDGGQRSSEETVVEAGGQRSAQDIAPESVQAQDSVIDASQAATAQEPDHSESHDPATDVTVHKISPQADILNAHPTDIALPTALHDGKQNSFMAIENRAPGSKNLPSQTVMFNEASSPTGDGHVLPKQYTDSTTHHMLPPLSHIAQNVSDVDIEEETPTQMLASTEDVKNVDRVTGLTGVTGLRDIKEIKQVPKHVNDEKIVAHIEDDEKVFSITHPLLKPNEYNENLKEMLAKTKADLSAI